MQNTLAFILLSCILYCITTLRLNAHLYQITPTYVGCRSIFFITSEKKYISTISCNISLLLENPRFTLYIELCFFLLYTDILID